MTTTRQTWLHRFAVFTTAGMFVLLVLGVLVTTRRAGMADPVWPTYPWHLAIVSWEEPRPGFLIEHSHRLAGYLIGGCMIALAVGLGRIDDRRWMQVLGVVALEGVIIQGLLGGYRVYLDEMFGEKLAFFHGCFAQLVFALTVSIAYFTSKAWREAEAQPGAEISPSSWQRLRRIALIAVSVIYVQIVFGAMLRHTYWSMGLRGHLLFAVATALTIGWLVKEIVDHFGGARLVYRTGMLLLGLLILQGMLGVEAWMTKFSAFGLSGQVLVRSTHVMVGFVLFSTAVFLALQACRMEGVA